MDLHLRMRSAVVLILVLGCLGPACYFGPRAARQKVSEQVLSEAEAEKLVGQRLRLYGIRLVSNMKLEREGVSFTADGYDRDMRVGFEYRSHEGGDFEGEADQLPEGLTAHELEALAARMRERREFFLVVDEAPKAVVEKRVEQFVELLFASEVLKKGRSTAVQDELFPEKDARQTDMLPWETTGDLKEKRQDMEAVEKQEGALPERPDRQGAGSATRDKPPQVEEAPDEPEDFPTPPPPTPPVKDEEKVEEDDFDF